MESEYNFSWSKFILMLGGQILFFILILGVILFGVPTMSFPANSMRNIINKNSKQ